MLLLLLAIGCGDAEESQDAAPAIASQSDALVTGSYTYRLKLLAGSSPAEYPLAAFQSLKLGDKVVVESTGVLAQAFSSGTAQTQIGVEATLGSVVSQGAVDLRDRVRIEGSVRSGGAVTQGVGATVSEGIEQNVSVGPYEDVTLAVDFSGASAPDRVISSGTQTLAPGRYRALQVMAGATVVLNSGTYYFTKLTLESNSTLALGPGTDPVVVHLSDSLIYRGRITGPAPDSRLLLGIAGVTSAFVETTFQGTIIAPEARLVLGQSGTTHVGGFFAKELEVYPHVKIQHKPFKWTGLLPPRVVEWKDAPVVLVATRFPNGTTKDGTSTPPSLVPFTIPPHLRVTAGNAGNGTATLTFKNGSGQTVTCQYKGGASVAAPRPKVSRVDWARGLRYNFVSCSNGLGAGANTSGRDFRLRINSGDTLGVKVQVDTQLGGGCTAPLDEPIETVQTAEIVQSFDWNQTQALPETDPSGRPSLYYVWIYVETKQQLRGLNKMGVHYSHRPLFATDMARYAGKCGTFDYEGDGQGMFVHAIVPGKLYNYLRRHAVSAVNNGRQMPFRVIHIPNKPNVGDPTLWNANGSLSWDALKRHRFEYVRGQGGGRDEQQQSFLVEVIVFLAATKDDDETLVDQGVDVVNDIGNTVVDIGEGFVNVVSYFGKLDELWEEGQRILDETAGAITDFIGEIDKFLNGSVRATIDLDVTTRDRLFSGKMVRGWGPNAGTELAPVGARAFVKQWSVSIFGIFPVSYRANLDANGIVDMSVGRNNSPRGESGFCVELENDYAMVSSSLVANEVCDFRDLGFNFRADYFGRTTSDDYRLNALVQATDGGQYLEQVVGVSPAQAEIGTGLAANIMTGVLNSDIPVAPCLDFPSGQNAIINTLAPLLTNAVTSTLPAAFFLKDIFIGSAEGFGPTAGRHSRGSITHEYGHFAMCSMMADRSPASLGVLAGRVFANADERSDELALFLETFADFFASQVAGGTNYHAPFTVDPTGVRFAHPGYALGDGMAYCHAPPCLERNYRGLGDTGQPDFNDELGRTLGMVYDAFDKAGRLRSDPAPSAGDLWAFLVPGTLMPAPKYLPPGNVDDERVSLSGFGLKAWVDNWMDRSSLVKTNEFMPALTDTLREAGFNWCDVCDVYALHSPDVFASAQSPSIADRFVRQNICARDPQIVSWLGAPPDPFVRFDSDRCIPCGVGQVSVNGVCTNCGLQQVVSGNTCQDCPAGSVVSADRSSCIPCGNKALATNGVCVPCGADMGADHVSHTCVKCAADAVVDWSEHADQCQVQLTFDVDPTTPPPPGDFCPDEFWIEIRNPKSLLTGQRQQPSIDVLVTPLPMPNTEATCENTLAELTPFVADFGGRHFPEARFLGVGEWVGCPPCPVTNPNCICLLPCRYNVGRVWTRGEISDGRADPLRAMVLRPTFTADGFSTSPRKQIRVHSTVLNCL